ncbi:MAG: beta-ketoacyl-ACP synthase III [Limnobacter sp.]|nr:beta-ketoacyl-ACP synthase III [Limnobacter sp.]
MSEFSRILGVGACLPRTCVSNDELVNRLASKGVETSSEWIVSRTGIQQRFLAERDETATSMGVSAAKAALAQAGKTALDVDLIVVATSTSDQIFPSTACSIQASLQATKAFAFDVQAVCSGFVYGLTVANSMIRSGQVKSALVIGTEVFSRLMDWNDRSTCVLFGDGAGAVYLEQSDKPGILGCLLKSDGSLGSILNAPGRVENGLCAGDPFLRMEGQSVFKQAVSVLGQNAHELLEQCHVELNQLDLLVPHQANIRILQSLGKKLGLSEEQVVATVAQHGNTSAASVPLALEQASRHGRLKPGTLVMLQGVGGGFTWGSVLVRM